MEDNTLSLDNNLDWLASGVDSGQWTLLNEELTFSEYLKKVEADPKLARSSYQRLYDMIMSAGTKTLKRFRKTYTHYNFFDNGEYPVFGLDQTLDLLVKHIRGAAGWYGTEKRILLLHGPVGSSKSTICRRLKRGLEKYSRLDEGAWYTYKWVNLPTEGPNSIYTHKEDECPMNDDPLKLIPKEVRDQFMKKINDIHRDQCPESEQVMLYTLRCDGDLNPRCSLFMKKLLKQYKGDWKKIVETHIRVVRQVYSESERVGIATFQPKDEKNQDATELTGDIDYSKLPHFGADSDARAFNFDGEFCVGNRGMVEFIEMLKLAQEFLYDLLGASQERQIKPKKFAQIGIDTVLIGHSVHEDTPVPHVYDGKLDVLPISEMSNLDVGKLHVFSVDENTGRVELTQVKNVFSHDFEGEWIENHQSGETLITTPNHSVYKVNYGKFEQFYPGEDSTSEIVQMKLPLDYVLNYPKTERWIQFFNVGE